MTFFAEMEYVARGPGTVILNIHALRTPHQTVVISETFTTDPYIKVEELVTTQGENRLIRFEISEPGSLKVTYKASIDNFCEIRDFSRIDEIPVAQMDQEVFPLTYIPAVTASRTSCTAWPGIFSAIFTILLKR